MEVYNKSARLYSIKKMKLWDTGNLITDTSNEYYDFITRTKQDIMHTLPVSPPAKHSKKQLDFVKDI